MFKMESPGLFDDNPGQDEKATSNYRSTEPETITTSLKKRIARPYQLEATQKFYEAKARGIRKMMLVLPTGTGKTFIFSQLANQHADRGEKVLIVAHREELINQAVASLSEMIPRQNIGIVKAKQREHYMPVVVASVASIASDRQRMKMGKYDLIIIDESHRTLAKSYRGVIANLLTEKGCVLGVTATPERGDGRAMAEVYEEIIFQMSLGDAINDGWLAHLECKRIRLKANFDDLKIKKTTGGDRDFDATEVCTVLDREDWQKVITDAWLEHASDRKTIGFLPSVAFAHRLAEYMQSRGISAVAIDGTTDKFDRRKALKGFGTEYQVLLNCALLIEGVDLPTADCILSAAMTASLGRYMQSIGRGTRKAEGKKNCLILDVVGVSKKNRIQQSFNLGCIRECRVCKMQSSLEYKSLGNDEHSMPSYACVQCHRQIKCVECKQSGKEKYFITGFDSQGNKGAFYICRECKPIGEARAKNAKKKRNVTSNGFADVNLLSEARAGEGAKARFLENKQRRIGAFLWSENLEARTLTLDLPDRSIAIVHYHSDVDRSDGYNYYCSDPLADFEGWADTRAEALEKCEEYAMSVSPEAALPSDWKPATERQMAAMHRLRIPYDPNISIKDASKKIGERIADLNGSRRFDSTTGRRDSDPFTRPNFYHVKEDER